MSRREARVVTTEKHLTGDVTTEWETPLLDGPLGCDERGTGVGDKAHLGRERVEKDESPETKYLLARVSVGGSRTRNSE